MEGRGKLPENTRKPAADIHTVRLKGHPCLISTGPLEQRKGEGEEEVEREGRKV